MYRVVSLCVHVRFLESLNGSFTEADTIPGIKLPSHFATLGAIASQVEKNKFEYVAKVICGYIVVDALLLVLMTVRVKNMDIRFIAKE